MCCLLRELFSAARALLSASCHLSVTPWGRGQREPAGWWPGDLMGPLRQSQAGSREAARQRHARSTGTRVRGGSELVWEPVVPREARKTVGLQVELSDAFQQLLKTELPNPHGLSGILGGPGTSLGSSRRFLQRSCSRPSLKDASTGQEATCAPVGPVRGCLSSPSPAAFSEDAKKQVYLAAPPALRSGNS